MEIWKPFDIARIYHHALRTLRPRRHTSPLRSTDAFFTNPEGFIFSFCRGPGNWTYSANRRVVNTVTDRYFPNAPLWTASPKIVLSRATWQTISLDLCSWSSFSSVGYIRQIVFVVVFVVDCCRALIWESIGRELEHLIYSCIRSLFNSLLCQNEILETDVVRV